MRIRWRNFELPSRVEADKDTLTSEYGRFVVEPFERGFGHTIGNGLRRVLLSSIEGTAITRVKIEGANHEFDSLEGVYEDVTDIILNIKRLRIAFDGLESSKEITCRVEKSGKGEVTGADVQVPGGRVANPEQKICTLTHAESGVAIELTVSRGRGYVSAEENRDETSPIGVIPVDSIYSPVHRVRYAVEATRVGKFTNYDRLILEIWTDGTISPDLSLIEAAKIYRKHLNPFLLFNESRDEELVQEDPSTSEFNRKNMQDSELQHKMSTPLSDLELSVRARNCLDGANLRTVGDLVSLSENEVMNLKNLGKTSLTEIKNKLAEHGLSLGMAAPR